MSTKKARLLRGRGRILLLFLLFDALLITATVLSFQKDELLEQEVVLEETRQVYDILYREQVITNTTFITTVIPFGSEKP